MPSFDKIGVQDLYGGESGESAATFTRKSRLDPRNTTTLKRPMPYVPALAYCTGNGVADDSAGLQQAYTDAKSLGLPLYIGKGTYNIGTTQMVWGPDSNGYMPIVYGDGPLLSTITYTGSSNAIVNGTGSETNKPLYGQWVGFQVDASGATCDYVIDLIAGANMCEFDRVRLVVADGKSGWFLRGDNGAGTGLNNQYNNYWHMCDVQTGTGQTGLYGWRLGWTADVENGRCNANHLEKCRIGNDFSSPWLVLGVANEFINCTINACSENSGVFKGCRNNLRGCYFDSVPPEVIAFDYSDDDLYLNTCAVHAIFCNNIDRFDYTTPHTSPASRIHDYSHASYAASFTADTCTFVSGSATAVYNKVTILGTRGMTMQYPRDEGYQHYLSCHRGTHFRSYIDGANTSPTTIDEYPHIKFVTDDNDTTIASLIGAQDGTDGEFVGILFSAASYAQAAQAVSDGGGITAVIMENTDSEFRVCSVNDIGNAYTQHLSITKDGVVSLESGPLSLKGLQNLPTGATPSVSAGNLYGTNNSEATSITNFTGATNGQILMLIGNDSGNTTVTDTANIKLNTAGNIALGNTDTLMLILQGTIWYELSRSDN